MQLNFTINYVVDVPKSEITARVVSVADTDGENITKDFSRFCEERQLPLTSEEEIETAAYEYGRNI